MIPGKSVQDKSVQGKSVQGKSIPNESIPNESIPDKSIPGEFFRTYKDRTRQQNRPVKKSCQAPPSAFHASKSASYAQTIDF